jgi:phosphoribosyl-dephospho-CoA transferase
VVRRIRLNAVLGAVDDEEARPHDLIEIAPIDGVVGDVAFPPWVLRSLRRAPFVVARRSRRRGGALPVGIRGDARHERFAAFLAASAVVRRLDPETLARDEAWRKTPRAAILPHFALLDRVAASMYEFGLAWGPAGSIGYELASGSPAVTPASDIDLVVRAPKKVSRTVATLLLEAFAVFPIHVDVLLETPFGAVALAEHARGSAQIALRMIDGPRLVRDPWGGDIFEHCSG